MSTFREDQRLAGLTAGFVGREWVFRQVDDWLADVAACPVFLITGVPGSGKSALAASFVRNRKVAAAHFCVGRRIETLDPVGFVRSLGEQLCRFEGYASEIAEPSAVHLKSQVQVGSNQGTIHGIHIEKLILTTTSPGALFNRVILEPLRRLCAKQPNARWLILVDALDETTQFVGPQSIVNLISGARGLSNHVRWLLTTQPDSAVLGGFDGMQVRRLDLDAFPAETEQDVRRYIQQQMQNVPALRTIAARQGRNLGLLEDQLVTHSGRNFLYLTWLLRSMGEGAGPPDGQPLPPDLPRSPAEDFSGLPIGLDGVYRETLRTRNLHQDRARWRSLIRPLLGVLAAAKDSLSLDQLAILSDCPAQDVSDALQELEPFLDPVEHAHGRLELYHLSFVEFLRSREAAHEFWIDLAAIHRRLAEHALARCGQSIWTADPYVVKFLPTHLSRAGMVQEVDALLTDPAYLETRANLTSVNNLLADFRLVTNPSDLLRAVERSLRLESQFLRAPAPLLLPQLFANLLGAQPAQAAEWRSRFAPALAASRHLPTHWLRRENTCQGRDDGRLVITLQAAYRNIAYAAFLTTERQIVVYSNDGEPLHDEIAVGDGWGKERYAGPKTHNGIVEFWDADSGTLITTRGGPSSGIIAVAVSPSGEQLCASFGDGRVTIQDSLSGRVLETLQAPSEALCVVFSPVNPQVVLGCRDGSVLIWDLNTAPSPGTRLLHAHRHPVGTVRISPDGTLALSIALNHLILADVHARTRVTELSGSDRIDAAVFSPDSRRLYFVDTDIDMFYNSSIRVHDIQAHRKVKSFYDGYWVMGLAVSHAGQNLLSASNDHAIKSWEIASTEWDLRKSPNLWRLGEHRCDVISIVTAPEGDRAMSCDESGAIKIWNLDVPRAPVSGHAGTVVRSAFTPQRDTVLTLDYTGGLKAWEVDTGEEAAETTRLLTEVLHRDGGPRRARGLATAACGSLGLLLREPSQAIVLRPEAPDAARELTVQSSGDAGALCLSPSGDWAAVSADRPACEIHLWDLRTQARPQILRGLQHPVVSLAFSLDETRLVSGGGMGSHGDLALWEVGTGRRLALLANQHGGFQHLAFAPTGERIYGVSGGQLSCWDLNLRPCLVFPAREGVAVSLALSPDGRRLATGWSDGWIRVWSLDPPRELAVFHGEVAITGIAFDPSGTQVLAVDAARLPSIYRFTLCDRAAPPPGS